MKKLLILPLALLLGIEAQAQITKDLLTKKDANNWDYYYTENDPLKARIYTLENGLTVYLSDYKAVPRVQTYIAVRTGSANDPADNTGLAHYLEHILFKGTSKIGTSDWEKEKVLLDKIEVLFEEYRKIPIADSTARKKHYAIIDSVSYEASKYAIANEYDKLLSYIGADGTNAYTWFDQTVYVNDIPSNQVENWLKIESERFREVLPRLFHTELEAVYEEKNRGLDNDGRRVWEELFAASFTDHPYGTQTTIGTVEHLKNPSITAIKEYFKKYYIASNMAICLSGDLDLDLTIKQINEYFKSYPSLAPISNKKKIASPLSGNVEKTVTGPSSESVSISYRFDGANTKEALMMELVSMVLSNSQAGLIDLNLNQEQKVIGAYSYPLRLNDYSLHILSAKPRAGQTLDEVNDLLKSQIDLIANGDFPDWLLDAIINDYKLSRTHEMESNKSRADFFVTNFIRNQEYKAAIDEIEELEKMTKADLVNFVKTHYTSSNAFVRIDKVKGVDSTIQKVTKPAITSVLLNREKKSDFLNSIFSNKVTPISPDFIDYKKDITKGIVSIKEQKIPLLYNQNIENELFEMYYIFDFGTEQNKKLGLALTYLEYLGCEGFSASELSQEFYKLGCTYALSTSKDQLYISLSGLSENFDKAIALLEQFLATAMSDQDTYDELVASILKARENNKLDKSQILNKALVSYAKYGKDSPYTDILSQTDLETTKPEELTQLIKKIGQFEHKILYYGPLELAEISTKIALAHRVESLTKDKNVAKEFTFKEIEKNTILFTEYDMVQAEIIMLSKSKKYNVKRAVQAALFNEYFGGNMGSIVFQEMRESKALAYSVKSYYQVPNDLKTPAYVVSYIGTQADKSIDAILGMNDLLDNFIIEEGAFVNAKESLISSLETSRSIKSAILFNYLKAQKLNQKKDISEKLYKYIVKSDIKDVQKFHKKYVQNKPKTYLIIGKKENLDWEKLKQFGTIEELNLDVLFGY